MDHDQRRAKVLAYVNRNNVEGWISLWGMKEDQKVLLVTKPGELLEKLMREDKD